VAQYEPAGHGVQILDAASEKDPVRQLEQLEVPVLDEYLPEMHDEQTVAEDAEYLPASQVPVTADNPIVAQYDPAVQEVQIVEPELAA